MDRNKAADLAYAEGYRLGADSRDAEVVSLTNQRDYEYVRAENAEQERDQLRAQVNDMRAGMEEIVELSNCMWSCQKATELLASTPEQSLAQIRNQVREDIAREFDGEVWAYDYREIAARIRAMKEPE